MGLLVRGLCFDFFVEVDGEFTVLLRGFEGGVGELNSCFLSGS